MADNRNTVLYIGLTVAAVAAGWWLVGRLRKPAGGPGDGFIGTAEASRIATIWAGLHADANALTLIGQTRIVFKIGKPPLMSSADWTIVGGTPTAAFYYVEFSYVGDNWLTVMIDAITGEKPPVSQGWVAGRLGPNFGL